MLSPVSPAALVWPEPALQPGQKEPLLVYASVTACGQCFSGEKNTHMLCGGMTARGGKVRKLPQEVTLKLGPEHQKFQSGGRVCADWRAALGGL